MIAEATSKMIPLATHKDVAPSDQVTVQCDPTVKDILRALDLAHLAKTFAINELKMSELEHWDFPSF